MKQDVVEQINITPLNFFSVEWITKILIAGAKNKLKIPVVPKRIQAENVILPKTDQVFLYLVKKYWIQILMAILLQGAAVACVLTIPTYLQQIILYLDPKVPKFILKSSNGALLAAILFALQLARTVFLQTSNQFSFFLQMDLKTLLTGAIYEKSLKLSQASSRKFTQGQILNIVNVDIEKVSLAFLQFASLLMAPVQVVWSVVLLGDYLGYSVWAGAGSLFAILFLQMAVIGFLAKYQKEFLSFGDKRLKMIREVLYGIKIIKFRALENFFYERITKIRLDQMAVLKKYYFIQVYFVGLIQVAPIAMPIGAFLTYGAVNGSITADRIFPSLALFNGLFQPILTVPQSITAIVVALVSWKRIVEFLLADEAAEIVKNQVETDLALEIRKATFEWDAVKKEEPKEEKKGGWGRKEKKEEEPKVETVEDIFRLEDIDIKVKRGSKVAIVGAVGSGKSSLLSGLIGDMPKTTGDFEMFGSVAYCAQQPWILTDTIEGNIVFHQAFNQEKLDKVLKACGLDADLEMFPARIKTEIGEKGVNLSGGQKARVALARAMYRNPDLLLLDDPISALDAQVGRLVFESGIMDYLKEKTVLLVTHQLFLLPDVDHIVILDKGKLVEQGTFKELNEKKGFLTEMMKSYRLDDQNTTKAKQQKNVDVEDETESKGGIIVEEEKQSGNVRLSVFWDYFEKCGGWTYIITLVSAALLNSATQIINNLWLSWWTTSKFGYTLNTYMTVYGYLGLGQFAFALVINAVFLTGAYKASKYYHGAALKRLLRAPMGFFDSQPIGRILNRMSKDIESVDQNIWIILFLATISFAGALSSLIFLTYTDYRMLYLVAPLSVLYFFILKYYQRSNIEFKRFESNNRSPLYAHISETLAGISTVKAFGVSDKFIKKQRSLMDDSNAPTFLRLFAQVWVSLRLELLGSTLTLTLALLGVSAADSSSEDAALIGLSLTYAIGFAGLLNLLLFSSAQLENEFNSIERLSLYCNELPQESADVKDDDPKENWPQQGQIKFENVCLSYPSRPDVMILKNLSFEVKPGEKVGIIGRTGSGKSTLMTALYRLVDLVDGKIEIDGYDTSSLGLKTLRQNIEIIPQEPVLFSGTIRENLDVESLYEDADVWDVLERIGLKEYVSSLSEKLQSSVLENGENLSVGQRQLICLGRAILSKPKILIMDEATASVDTEADALIQDSIKTQFKDTTVLSIAHRLNTIADFDRVLVLQDGVKMEFDTPHELFKNPKGLFSQLADATGSANSALLREIALHKHSIQ